MLAARRQQGLFLLLAMWPTLAGLCSAAGFLGDKLPLKVAVTTPYELLEAPSVQLEDTQTITVVFSRPVQALGSGFETSSTPDQIPFSLSCGVPGRIRWVTTFIARFDASIPWPSDLNCTLMWNRNLTAYDGATLVRTGLKDVALTTKPLAMQLLSVSSATAAKLTEGLWSADIGSAADKLPEVPPDGSLMLSVSSNVSLDLVQAALKVYEDRGGKPGPPTAVGVKVALCPPDPVTFEDESSATAATANCLQVNLTAPLKRDTYYQLCLPAGTKYSRYGGGLSEPLCTRIAGLRPFRIPLQKGSELNGVAYRRMDLWLPHGLAAGADMASLGSALNLCQVSKNKCVPVKLALTHPAKATLRIAAAFQPGARYRLQVKASASIKDGYGQPLQASSTEFSMSNVESSLLSISTPSQLATLEPANGSSPVTWPYIAYGQPKDAGSILFWGNVGKPSRLTEVLSANKWANEFNKQALGKLDGTVINKPSEGWHPLLLNTSGVPGPWAVATCCRDGGKTAHGYALLQESGLMATAVRAGNQLLIFVTASSGPAAGMALDVYKTVFDAPAQRLGSGTTNSQGVAVVKVPPAPEGNPYAVVAVLKPEGQAPVILPGLEVNSMLPTNPYCGALVLDRRLVRTGEVLRVSGAVRRLGSPGSLALPRDTAFALQLSPNPLASNNTPPHYPLTIDPAFGTFTYDLPIPSYAQYVAYTLSVVAASSSGTKAKSSSVPPGPLAAAADVMPGSEGGPFSAAPTPEETPAPPPANLPLQVPSAEAYFQVADPRPPTVALELTVPKWVAPNTTVVIGVQTVSYLGSAVSEAPIGITWKVEETNAQGVLNATTNARGEVNVTLDLSTIPSLKPSRSITLTAEWVGPTRERVTKTASVLIAEARYGITLQRSWTTSIPGERFYVTAAVYDNEAGKAVTKGTVTVSITAPAKGPKPGCGLPPACSITAGSRMYSNCSLAVPCIGDFVLQACYKSSCTSTPIGNNATTWKQNPWKGSDQGLQVTSDAENYTVGQSARIFCQIPSPASAVMLVIASATKTTTKVYKNVPAGLLKASVKIVQPLAAGATVQVVAHLPRSKQALPKVPISKVYDPNAPTSLLGSVTLTVTESRELEVAIKAPDHLEPGATAQVGINVKGAGGPTRVVVLAVDQAILDLVPYPLPSLSDGLTVTRQLPEMGTSTLGSTLADRAALEIVYRTALRLLAKDPWLPSYNLMSLKGVDSRHPADTPEQELLNQYVSQLTPFPSGGFLGGDVLTFSGYATIQNENVRPIKLRSRSATAVPASASDTPTDGSQNTAARVDTDFATTPLFTVLTVDASGSGVVNFTAPANLGTFALRAFAVTGASSKAGSAEAVVVVRRAVSLTQSTPRFVRTGDTFEAGVIVTAATAEASLVVNVDVKLAAGSRATLLGDAAKKLTLGKDQKQQEVRFKFKASDMDGNFTATFTASAGTDSSDALQVTVPVVQQLQPVVLGTSFAINASASTPWQEGLELPGAAPGTGSVELTASVGFLAAVQASHRQVTSATPETPDGYWAAAVAVHSGALAMYKQPVKASPKLKTAVRWLKALTSPRLGLAPYPPALGYYPARPDTYLNTWAAWLVSHYPAAKMDPFLSKATPVWAAAAAAQLTADAQEYRATTGSATPDLEAVAWVRAVLGSKWKPKANATIQADLSWSRLTRDIPSLSLTARSLVALTLLKEKAPTTDKTLVGITQRLQSALRTQGRTAYVAQGTGASAAGIEDQALALMVLSKARTASPLIPKLAAYLAAGKPPAPILWATLPTSTAPRPAALMQVALASYDVWVGNTQPDLSLSAAASNTTTLLTATFKGPSTTPVTRTTPWARLPRSANTIDFKANGTGQATIAATLRFVPSRPLQSPTYRGIWVEKAYQAISAGTGDTVGPPLGQVKLGSLVAVTVQLTTPDDLPDVELQVQLPAGLEPQDPSVFTDAAAQLTCGEGDQGPSLARRFPWWWWPVCPAQETRPQTVTFRYAQLTAGSHSVRFLAVAASAGAFADPPVKAFATKQPELMGMTASSLLTVCDGAGCASAAAPAAQPLKDCNAGCSGNGACNLTTGTCICDKGFGGADCSKATP